MRSCRPKLNTRTIAHVKLLTETISSLLVYCGKMKILHFKLFRSYSVKIFQCFCRRRSWNLFMFLGLAVVIYLTSKIFYALQTTSDRERLENWLHNEISIQGGGGSVKSECNLTKSLKIKQFSGTDFLNSWREVKAEFVSSLKKLLSVGATSTDARLLSLLRRFMFPPSKRPYKMSYNFGPPPQEETAMKYFKNKGQNKGFFVECGGLDGERSSNTYHLEKAGWRGLIIEADADYFLQILGKNRKAWKLNAALCPSKDPSIVKFQEYESSGAGKVVSSGKNEVPCIPLGLAMKALNQTRIDFFSLDVEGLEMKILRSLPYADLDIKAITMEYLHNTEKPDSITKFMLSNGYTLHQKIDKTVVAKGLYTHDLFFVKK